eukprot:TRINITY_DN68761_c0_g1_i1.p1 TRINITY_DN68761_c0_g1~~TRINITY_DN68761_c0_g1_i1.p1  ORF type:complete len:204 (-),score=107.01 TRINITY_DN68761_c0_g1_i1:266-877(-)
MMLNQKTFLLFAVCAAAVLGSSQAFECGCFRSQYQADLLAIMCSGDYVPKTLLGWGAPLNTWFVVDCKYCGTFNCTRGEDPAVVEERYQEFLTKLDDQQYEQEQRRLHNSANHPAPEQQQKPEQPVVQGPKRSGNDVIPCCCYAKKEYYYTEGIHCDALNPTWRDYCVSEEYGAQIIGQWHVESLENQCYFITGINNTVTTKP